MTKDTWKVTYCDANDEKVFQTWEKTLIKFPTTQITASKGHNWVFLRWRVMKWFCYVNGVIVCSKLFIIRLDYSEWTRIANLQWQMIILRIKAQGLTVPKVTLSLSDKTTSQSLKPSRFFRYRHNSWEFQSYIHISSSGNITFRRYMFIGVAKLSPVVLRNSNCVRPCW